MATSSSRSPFRRRSLFKAAGIGAAGAAGLPIISACSDIESSGGSTQATEGLDVLPTYKEWSLPLEPDLVGEPPNHPSGFTSYPEPVQAVTEVPSNSGTYEITVPMWGEPPSSDDPYYQAVFEAWGGTQLNIRHADGNDFADTSVQWLQAEEFGDAIHMFSWMLLSHTDFQATVTDKFYDLTDIVAGDISDRWPLLAGLPTSSWGRSVWSTDPEDPETARIFGIPGPASGGANNGFFARTDLLEADGLAMPTTVDEVLEIARAWTDDSAGRWAFAGLDYYTPQWFGLPSGDNWWYDEETDTIKHRTEHPGYAEWLEFRRTAWDEGLVHPDAPTGTLDTQALHQAGTILFQQDGISWWQTYIDRVNNGEAEGDIEPLGPIATSGRDPLVHVNHGIDGWTFLSKHLEPEQVEEILDVANFCAAPYGTTEYELLNYGVEGEHFDYGDDGTPVYTEVGTSIVQAPVNYKTITRVQNFLSGDPAFVQRRFDYNASVLEYAEVDIFEGIRVEGPADFKAARATLEDQENDVSYGRAELSSIPDMVESFLNSGGEAAREHYAAAYEAARGE